MSRIYAGTRATAGAASTLAGRRGAAECGTLTVADPVRPAPAGLGPGDDGVAALLASAYLACTQLTLRENDIGDEGAEALAGALALARCRALFLARNQLGDEAVAALAGSAHLAGLEQLGIGGNEGITDEGLANLLAPGVFPRMRRLELEMLDLEDETMDALRERWGAHVRF
jgi:Ran GTPase-activating protein (RanGAP) involved in mRNA processing and transport